MAGWGDVLEEADEEVNQGSWSEVLHKASPQGGAWDEVLAEEADLGGEPIEDKWGEVLGDASESNASSSGDDFAALEDCAVVSAQASGLDVYGPATASSVDVVTVVRECRTQLVGAKSGGPVAIGRCVAQVRRLPEDAALLGRQVFRQVGKDIGLTLARTDRVQTLEHVREETGCKDKGEVGPLKCLMVSAVVSLEHFRLLGMLDTLTARVAELNGRCLVLTVKHRYDETPLKLRSMDSASMSASCDSTARMTGKLTDSLADQRSCACKAGSSSSPSHCRSGCLWWTGRQGRHTSEWPRAFVQTSAG